MSNLKVAALVTAYYPKSHAQHIVDRLLEGYGWAGRHHRPDVQLVALHVAQRLDNDVSGERAGRFAQLQHYATAAEALTLGGSELAVDGVLLIGEHGDYPRNEKGQKLYPRYEMFQQILEVFRASGRGVPVFNDKHLSWHWPWALEIVKAARALPFPLMAGSSVPVAPRMPAVDLPWGARIDEAMSLCYGSLDSYDFHGLEMLQAMNERRAGAETGVRWLRALRGQNVWAAFESGELPYDLLEACLTRSDHLKLDQPGQNTIFPSYEQIKQAVQEPLAYRYEHTDGLRCTMLMLNGLVGDWTYAARLADRAEPWSVQMYLRMPGHGGSTLATFFTPLVHHIEQFFATGQPPWPIERTLLTTGLTAAGIESMHRGQVTLQTPELAIAYEPSSESTFCRV